jgi:uncharacterized protein with HEPN domain
VKDDRPFVADILGALERVESIGQRVPWDDLAGFRDVLIHQYFRVDLEILWAMIEARVGSLRQDVETIASEIGARSQPR